MMKLNRWLVAGGMAVALCLSATELMAQGRGGRGGGGFDPAQFQQRMMERYKEQLEIKDDAEWKAIQPLVQKVMDARMATMRGFFGRRGGPGGGPPSDQGDRPSNTEGDALQKAVDSKASNAELKAALAKYADARKAKQADLEKAQGELRAVLSVRQEALATLAGLL